MLRLVEKYSNFDTGQDFRNSAEATPGHLDHKEVVVITGVTGSLGAHTVDLLRSDSTVTAECRSKVTECMRRAAGRAARVRFEAGTRCSQNTWEHGPALMHHVLTARKPVI